MTRADPGVGLRAHEVRLRHDLECLGYPPADWVQPRAEDGDGPIDDVIVVGAGMCGLTAAFALLRRGVRRLRLLDRSPAGREGPWVTYARMETLRSPKHLTGPALGIPALTFRAWYEAQWGRERWEALGRIPRTQWMDYLRWYREVLELPVENDVRVTAVRPDRDDAGLVLDLETARGAARARARKVVLASGREGIARPRIPPPFERFLGERVHHSADAVDFAAMAGARVAVVGIGASAMDNAAAALEHGAARVHMLARAPAIPRINKGKAIVYSGFTEGFPKLPDEDHLAMLGHIAACRIAPPRDSVRRVAHQPAFELHLSTAVDRVEPAGEALRLHCGSRTFDVDHAILATGFRIDLAGAPELAALGPHIARWRDRLHRPDDERLDEFLDFPYLGPGLEFLERVPGAAPALKHLHCFNYAAALSHGNVSSDIPAVSEGAERLAVAMAAALFVEDADHHRERLHAYADPELLGDEIDQPAWWPPL